MMRSCYPLLDVTEILKKVKKHPLIDIRYQIGVFQESATEQPSNISKDELNSDKWKG